MVVARTTLMQSIEEVARTYIGQVMGKAASTAHLQRLAIDDEQIPGERVEAVLKSLRGSLKVLVGDQTADKAVDEIRARIGLR